MHKIFCQKCHGTGGYERPCHCFADEQCPKCQGTGYYWQVCIRCQGKGMERAQPNESRDGYR